MDILLTILTAITVYVVIIAMLGKSGSRKDTVKRRIEKLSSKSAKAFVLDDDISKPLSERFVKPIIKALAERFGRLTRTDENSNSARAQKANKLKKMLSQAGFTLSVAEFGLIRFVIMVALVILFVLLAMAFDAPIKNTILVGLLGLFVGYIGIRFYLTKAITSRKRSMEQQLPDMLDLLSVSVEAGLGFEQAILHITNHMSGPLIDELTVTCREMQVGRSRREALQLFGERCDIDEIKSFVGAIIQATQLGISMKNVLRTQSAAMRQSRKAKVQEKAQKLSIKILIPMVAFIFPVIFIVLLGPALVNIMETLG